jgi:hypothetical protein
LDEENFVMEIAPVFGVMALLWGVGILLGLGLTVLWVLALVEVATKETDVNNQRLVWLLIVIFVGWLGALLYFIVRRPERQRELGN